MLGASTVSFSDHPHIIRTTSVTTPPSYTPPAQLRHDSFDKAIKHFKRREASGCVDIRVVVATAIPITEWKTLRIPSTVKLEVEYVDEMTVQLVITKLQSPPHEQVVSAITGFLHAYSATREGLLAPGGGFVDVQRGNGRRRLRPIQRSPDSGLRPMSHEHLDPHVIVEVEFRHRSLEEALYLAQEYFRGVDRLQAMVLVKFEKPQLDGRFACVAIMLRRVHNEMSFADVVSFGSIPIDQDHVRTRNDFSPNRNVPVRLQTVHNGAKRGCLSWCPM